MNKNSIRQTFGILDKDGNLYRDIKSATIIQKTLSPSDNEIVFMNECYRIHKDFALEKELASKGTTFCIISIQKRTTGNVAEARIFNKRLSLKKEQN